MSRKGSGRSERFTFHMSRRERDCLEALADGVGVTMSDWLRMTIIGEAQQAGLITTESQRLGVAQDRATAT